MNQIERFIYRTFQIDTNRINSRSKLENMNQLERWHNNRVIHIEMSEVAQQEAVASRDLKRVDKTFSYIFSETLVGTDNEQEALRKIENILFPAGAKRLNEKNDVEIVFNVKKYTSILVTADGASKSQPGGILGHKAELKGLGIEVITDEEAVAFVRNLIQKRDQMAINRHEKFGLPLPDWVGKD